MNGPTHYKAAEALLENAESLTKELDGNDDEFTVRVIGLSVEMAAVHARLAEVAVLADASNSKTQMLKERLGAWDNVIHGQILG